MLCRSCLGLQARARDAVYAQIARAASLHRGRRHLHVPRPRLDFKRIREDADAVVKECKQRNVPIDKAHVARCVDAYDRFSKGTGELNAALSRRNALTKGIKEAASKEERQVLIDEAAQLKPRVQALQKQVADAEKAMTELAVVLPNTHSPHTPVGDESKVRILQYINEENQYRAEDELVSPPADTCTTTTSSKTKSDAKTVAAAAEAAQRRTSTPRLLDHVEISRRFDLVDFETASRSSGTGFHYLKNAAVQLELALVQLALSRAMGRGFMPMRPPDLVRSEYVSACGFAPRDTAGQQQIYETFGDTPNSLSLAGTAEIPLAALGTDAVYDASTLPRKIVGHGRAFRREAGARGAETRGLYRVHEFTKVELFAFCTRDQAEGVYDEMAKLQRRLVRDLGLCARVLEMPTAELGNSAWRKSDIESWIPSRAAWGEVTSLSNCTDYQARRLNCRYKAPPPAAIGKEANEAGGDKTAAASGLEFVHTLNGTGVAVPRLLVSALEMWYEARKDVIRLPDVLKPYMGGLEVIERP